MQTSLPRRRKKKTAANWKYKFTQNRRDLIIRVARRDKISIMSSACDVVHTLSSILLCTRITHLCNGNYKCISRILGDLDRGGVHCMVSVNDTMPISYDHVHSNHVYYVSAWNRRRTHKLKVNRLNAWLIYWDRVTYIFVEKLTISGSDSGLSAGQCHTIIWTNARILFIEIQWNFNRNSKFFIHENAIESVICEMASILSRSQCVKDQWIVRANHVVIYLILWYRNDTTMPPAIITAV